MPSYTRPTQRKRKPPGLIEEPMLRLRVTIPQSFQALFLRGSAVDSSGAVNRTRRPHVYRGPFFSSPIRMDFTWEGQKDERNNHQEMISLKNKMIPSA